jgi:hypothetical protein
MDNHHRWHAKIHGSCYVLQSPGNKYWGGGTPVGGEQFAYAYDGIGNRSGTTINGNAASYAANSLNQYSQRTVPGIVEVTGSASTSSHVTVNDGPVNLYGSSRELRASGQPCSENRVARLMRLHSGKERLVSNEIETLALHRPLAPRLGGISSMTRHFRHDIAPCARGHLRIVGSRVGPRQREV